MVTDLRPRILAASLTALCAVLVLCTSAKASTTPPEPAESHEATERSPLFLGNEMLPPMIYLEDGRRVGVVVDLAEAIRDRMGRPVTLDYMEWSRAQRLVLEGKADALLQINASEERRKILDFSDPLLESEFSIFVPADREDVYGVSSLRGLKVGVEGKGLPIDLLKRDPQIELVIVPDIVRGFRLLAGGGVDAIVVDRWVGSFVLADNDIRGIRIAGEPVERSSSAIAVRKGDAKLLAEINAALAAIRADGTYAQVLAKWQPKEVVFQTRAQLSRQKTILLATICVLAVVVIAALFLGREIRRRRAANKDLNAFLNSVPESAFLIDRNGAVLLANETAAVRLGTSSGNLIGSSIYDFLPDDIRQSRREQMERVVQEDRPLQFEDVRSGRTIHNSISPVTGPDGEVERLAVVGVDITNRVVAERALAESEEKFRIMMESMSDPVCICATDYTIDYMNPAMVSRTGYDATGEPCYKVVNGLDSPCDWCELEKIQEGKHFETEMLSPRDDRHYRVTHSPINRADGRVAKLTILRDITALKRMEEESLRTQKLEATGVLAGGMAHDLNNILSIVMGNIDLARSTAGPNTDFNRYLFEAEHGCKDASDLVRRFLNISGGSPLVKENTSLADLVDDLIGSQPSEEGFSYDISSSKDLWRTKLDRGQIQQVVIKLLANAKEAMTDGGTVEISLANHVVDSQAIESGLALKEGRHIRLSIRDHGVGIPEQNQTRLFDPYFSTKERGTQRGMGLGLTLCHNIIRHHDGLIVVDSEEGVGTVVDVYLPALT